MITQETAGKIAYAYADIKAAEKLLEEIEKSRKNRETPDFRDAYGRRRGLQLGIPCGGNGHNIMDLAPELGEVIIKAHIAAKKCEIEALCKLAQQEMHDAG